MTSIGEAQPFSDRARSRERNLAVLGAAAAIASLPLPRAGSWWFLLALAGGGAAVVAVTRLAGRSGRERMLPWPGQPAAGVGSLGVAGWLAVVSARAPLPNVWLWAFGLIAGFVALFGVFMLGDLLISKEGTGADGVVRSEVSTIGVALLAMALVAVSTVLH